MSALGFLICCAGSGMFGWHLHRVSDRSMIVRRDEADYRRMHCDDVIMRTLRDARQEALGRRPGEPFIDLRDRGEAAWRVVGAFALFFGCMFAPIIVALTVEPSDAHVPRVVADCQGLHVDLRDYEPNSTVEITVAGVTEKHTFSGAYRESFKLPSSGSWAVVVDNRGDGKRDQWDQSFTDANPRCQSPTTTSSTTTIPWVPLVSTTVPVQPVPVLIDTPLVVSREQPVVLAFTGSSVLVWLTATGLALIGVGVILRRTVRR